MQPPLPQRKEFLPNFPPKWTILQFKAIPLVPSHLASALSQTVGVGCSPCWILAFCTCFSRFPSLPSLVPSSALPNPQPFLPGPVAGPAQAKDTTEGSLPRGHPEAPSHPARAAVPRAGGDKLQPHHLSSSPPPAQQDESYKIVLWQLCKGPSLPSRDGIIEKNGEPSLRFIAHGSGTPKLSFLKSCSPFRRTERPQCGSAVNDR